MEIIVIIIHHHSSFIIHHHHHHHYNPNLKHHVDISKMEVHQNGLQWKFY